MEIGFFLLQVELLWRRALAETSGQRLYCLVQADVLDYDVSQKAVDSLHTLMQDYNNESKNVLQRRLSGDEVISPQPPNP